MELANYCVYCAHLVFVLLSSAQPETNVQKCRSGKKTTKTMYVKKVCLF